MRPLLLLIPLLATVVSCRPAPRGWSHEGLAGPEIRPPLPKPDLILTATDGRRFDLRRETQGFVTVLFFGYTRCPDLCPVQMANIAQAMQRVAPEVASRIKVVFVTVDPRRDTPAVLRTWLDHFDPRFIGLTGDSASIAYALTQLRLQHPEAPHALEATPGAYTINHTVLVLTFTTDDLAHVAYPAGIRVDDWARDLALLTKDG